MHPPYPPLNPPLPHDVAPDKDPATGPAVYWLKMVITPEHVHQAGTPVAVHDGHTTSSGLSGPGLDFPSPVRTSGPASPALRERMRQHSHYSSYLFPRSPSRHQVALTPADHITARMGRSLWRLEAPPGRRTTGMATICPNPCPLRWLPCATSASKFD